MKKYFYLYKITNLINNKIYIGVHTTYNLNDNYMGSGRHLKNSQIKYGIENFKKEILEYFNNKEDMYAKEKILVSKDFIKNSNNYNLNIGGNGGFEFINQSKKAKFNNGELIWNTKDRLYFNDGIKTYRLYENDPKIKYLKIGRLQKDIQHFKKSRWFTDGEKSYWLQKTDSRTKQLIPGRVTNKTSQENKKKIKKNYELFMLNNNLSLNSDCS